MDKRLKALISKLKKEKIPTLAVGLITKKDGSPNFFEVIIERRIRYSDPRVLKKLPKEYHKIKVKVI